jgi:hypothetical protein
MVSQTLASAILNQKAPDIVGSFREGQEFAKGQQVEKLTGQALQAGGGQKLQELIGLDPEVGYSLGEAIGARSAKELNNFIRDASITENFFKQGNFDQGRQFIQQSLDTVKMAGGSGKIQQNLLDIYDTQGPEAAFNNVQSFTAVLAKSKQQTSGMQDRASQAEALVGSVDPRTGEVFTLETANQALIRLDAGIDARQGMSAAERLGQDPAATQEVADSQAIIEGAKSGAKERGSAEVKSVFAPRLAAAIQTAKTKAESEGKVFSDLAKAEAGLPAVKDLIVQLKDLSEISTSNLSGRAFNSVVRELGFGATEGGTARAKFIAIVDNTLLPLLKQTFGAAFTVSEANQLKATLGDPNLSAGERNAQLDAFIENKTNEVRGLKRQAATISTEENASAPVSSGGFKILSVE